MKKKSVKKTIISKPTKFPSKTSKSSSKLKSPKKYQKVKTSIIKQKDKVKRSYIGEKINKLKTEHKRIFIAIIILIAIITILFGTKIFTLFNYLLGGETLVQLTAENQDFFLKNSEKATVEFEIYALPNLFCEANCEYTFQDISSGYVLDKSNFTTKLSIIKTLKYDLVAPERGEGQVLYNFKIICQSKEEGFCKTDEEEKVRSYLIALNYELSDEQKSFKNKSTQEVQKTIFKVDELNRINQENKKLNTILEEQIITEGIPKNNITKIEDELDTQLENLKKYEYEIVLRDGISDEINQTRIELVKINNNLTSQLQNYNNFTSELLKTRTNLVKLKSNKNISEENHNSIKNLIATYNKIINETKQPFYLELQEHFFNLLKDKIKTTEESLVESMEGNYTYQEIEISKLRKIEKPFRSNYTSGRIISPEEPMCCYKGDCEICCTDECKSQKEKYPIILIHGHSFNEAVSAEKSLGDLSHIKEELAKDGVIDGGYIILRQPEEKETFARTNKQIAFAASYYFDIYQNEEEFKVLETKADSLDTYALRLNDIIKNVKTITNRDKVYIVSHSMGGLVSRRYMQIFGDNDVEKLVMIGTPNHGVSGLILTSCSIFGADSHCKALDEESLFLNKLNYGKKPTINISTIIGLGCLMDGEDGDGIVKNKSAYLDWADNHYVKGNCTGTEFLHTKMLKVDKYPETYKILKKELGIN